MQIDTEMVTNAKILDFSSWEVQVSLNGNLTSEREFTGLNKCSHLEMHYA